MKRLIALDIAAGPVFRAALERAWTDGDAVFPLDRRLPRDAAEHMMQQFGVGVIATEHDRTGTSFGRPVGSDDAVVVATSGTGGEPRGAVLTHEAVRAAALTTSARLRVDAAMDRWLACLPLSHVGGLGVVTRAIHTDTPLEIHDGFEPEAVERAATEGATLVSLVETALNRIDATRFRGILVGGSAIRRETAHNVVVTYGMTESGGGIVYDGLPLDGVEIRIDRGQILIRGPMLLRCYRHGEDPKDADGWYATGDLGRFEDDRLLVDGRLHELIVTGGENVIPGPIEEVLAGVAGVREVAVVGRPDPEWGEAVTAVLVPADPGNLPNLESLREAVREVFPAYAAPRRLEIVDHLPRTSLGKIRRAQL
jgi:O-succinylbenzoic acid--CoA ligase